MHKTTKTALMLGLILTVLSITYLATPALAVFNGTDIGEQRRLQTGACDGDMLQVRQRIRLYTENQNCNGDVEGTQLRTRNNVQAENCICENGAEQYKMRHRQGA